MDKLLYFDYAAIAIMLIMLATIVCKRHFHGRVNKSFLFLLLVTLITVIFDIWAVRLDNIGPGNRLLKYITHDIYLITRNLTGAVFAFFLVALTDTKHKFSQNTKLKLIMPLPFFVVLYTVIASNSTGWVYLLDENDTYVRGDFFWILYASAIFYAVYAIVFIIKYTKFLGNMKAVALFTMFPFLIAAIIVQGIKPNILLEQLSTALALMFIMLMVLRPEQRIDCYGTQ